ncbi:hypothetical protein MSAN_01101700 [Mycena sanguinolenta]|uniref:Uncharacterized protein n=1 Tax=Mycena sanguinolenta TaxID=230812 RepID=A0A8H6YSK8_9AGAR|nr:hypothetical protein MSAN_01101700 [Mycena sanguinolenta]
MSSVSSSDLHETVPHPTQAEVHVQHPMPSNPDAAAIHESDGRLDTDWDSNRWRTVINYISGGQGGTGGGGVQGGTGGIGEGPSLQYDIKAERLIMNTVTNAATTPSDFLRIPLGNIDLRSEIRLDAETCHNEPMTVALYQGDNAEEEWKRDLSHYSALRHPHILQIYARASSSGIHAVVFHDDLIPFTQFLGYFRYSAILRAYISWYMSADLHNAEEYCKNIPPMKQLSRNRWIRRSTGRLCVEFSTFASDDDYQLVMPDGWPPQAMLNLHDPNQEAVVIASLAYPDWYYLFRYFLCQRRSGNISIREEDPYGGGGEKSVAVPSELVDRVEFIIEIPKTVQNPPEGYLFIRSPKDFEISLTSFRWPDCPAYWSLDPSGHNPLTPEKASSLGFPSITLTTKVHVLFWDETAYAGLGKFDECRGFDPESQDLAKELGYPLIEVCIPALDAMELDRTADRDDESDYSSSHSEEEYATAHELELDTDLASSYIEELTMENGNSLHKFSSPEDDGRDHSRPYPDTTENDPSMYVEELTVENEDPLPEFPYCDAAVTQYYSVGELLELVKFGLIIVFGVAALYDYAGICF